MLGFKRKRQRPCVTGVQDFIEVLKEIERIKDEILAAARLTRHETPPVVTANNVLKVAAIIGGTVVLSILIICAYLSGNFWAQFWATVVSLFGFLFAAFGLSG